MPNTLVSAPILDNSWPTTFTILDLELIHSWTSTSGPVTFREKPSNSSTFHLAIVEVALKHPFLMHEILSLSALYLAQAKPESATSYNLASTAHYDLAVCISGTISPSCSHVTAPILMSLLRPQSDYQAALPFSTRPYNTLALEL